MSIMELGALGEFVASMVVLVTLVYLVIQVKQTGRGILLATPGGFSLIKSFERAGPDFAVQLRANVNG